MTAPATPCSSLSPQLLLVAEEKSWTGAAPGTATNPPTEAQEGTFSTGARREPAVVTGTRNERLLRRQVLWFPKSRLKRL